MDDRDTYRRGLPYDLPPEDLDRDFDLVDLYVSYNFAEAELIADILFDNGIDCYVKKLEPSQFPINVGKHGQIRIAVGKNRVDAARAVLTEAMDAEALTRDGHFVTDGDVI